MPPRGRKGGVTPRLITEHQIIRLPAADIRPGFILHDGLVLRVDTEFSTTTGQPVKFWFETPGVTIYATAEERLNVYGRVSPSALRQIREAHQTT